MTLRPEDSWASVVIDLAHLLGWRVAHFRAARTKTAWRTPVAADGAGFVDLVLTRDRVVFAELKTDRGRLAPAQREWIGALDSAGAEVYVWRPRDLPIVRDALERRVGR